MNHLVIIRHGADDDRTGGLTQLGQQQIASLGEQLGPVMVGKTLILTSTAKRARESADILRGLHGSDLEECPLLYSGSGMVLDMKRLMELVISYEDQVDVIVLVTHSEWAGGFPSYFFDQAFGANLQWTIIMKGEAFVIDVHARSAVYIKPKI